MNPTAANVTKNYREILQGLKDEIHVFMQLARMEVKDIWRELEPLFLDAETAKGIATDVARTFLTEAIEKLIALRSRLHAKGRATTRT
jgi:hypothetical protein